MTKINDPNNLGNDLFGYKIKYNQVEGLVTPDTSDTSLQVKARFNGNIAEIDWKTSTQENEPLKTYGYVYDGLNRLSAGFYQDANNPSVREYYEKVTYDLNGNIASLKRTAQRYGTTAMLIDNLNYSYENNNVSNRLRKITESVQTGEGFPYTSSPTDIGYDANGNMTSFQDKGISSIQYNYLNLPKQITQNGQLTNYVYRADGVKMKKLFGTVETNYLDGFQYKFTQPWEDESGSTPAAAMKLRFVPTSEGYYDALLNLYVYNYVDHLGNIRLSYADSDRDGSIRSRDQRIRECSDGNCIEYFIPGEIVANNTYYPFGMLFDHNNQASSSNAYNYKYNGKELQETGMYDYGARFYMPDIGRWGVLDPLAEKMTRHSPYNYAFNNPIRFIDPDGMENEDIVRGSDSSSASKIHEDFNDVFSDKKFDSFRSLLTRGSKNDKTSFDKIDEAKFKKAIENLKDDDLALATSVYDAINSEKEIVFEYVDDVNSNLSPAGQKAFAKYSSDIFGYTGSYTDIKGQSIVDAGKEGFAYYTEKGAHAFIMNTANTNHLEGKRSLTSFHEGFGHGLAFSKGTKGIINQNNAIRYENMVRRVMGIKTMRDGTNPIHGSGQKVSDFNKQPLIK